MIQLVYGKNLYLISKKLREIEAGFAKLDPSGINLQKLDGSSITYGDLEQAFTAMPFLADKRLVIIRNLQLDNKDSEIKNKVTDRLLPRKTAPRNDKGGADSTDIVFVEMGEPDKRTRLYKLLMKEAQVYEARVLEGRDLLKFISDQFKQQGVEAKTAEADHFAMEAGNDMQKLECEIEKIALYVKSQKRQTLERGDIDLMVSAEIDPNVFTFTEAIARKDARTASRLLNELLANGENEQKLMGNIAYQFRTLLIIKDALERGINSNEIASKAKLSPFAVNKNISVARGKTMKSLVLMHDNLRRTDAIIKSSTVTPDLAINILVATLCR